ncbi:glycosyltransferase [Providencia rettgeri]|uniref:glycosyltransferase n=1 Tax=Providencia rettgeri TaxID=587 RepID=UPI00029BD4F8|nr:glycosyltransferase [Providencia rettgeri]EKT59809.1 hypothetical protein OOC_02427 [Providencia rettgeri Dmel1]
MKKINNLVIVDPCSGGHHDIYIQNITKECIGLVENIYVLSPHAKKIEEQYPCIGISYHKEIKIKNKFDYLIKYPFSLWYDLNKILHNLQLSSSDTLVFICYLDIYLSPFLSKIVFNKIFHYNFTGILFRSQYLRGLKAFHRLLPSEKLFSMKRCNSIGIVETPSNIKKLSKYTKKPIYYFPDFISTEKNNVSLNIAFTIDEIKKIACNRTIISMIGTIQKRKNIINLIDAASKLQNNVFVFIYGKLSSSDFSNSEIDKIRHGLPPNVIIYDRFIETESDINALYELTDIVWNAYLNWNFTSNALSKASYFKKAIISSNGSYISEICNKYTIGVTVNEDDIESIKSGILKCPTIIDNDNFLEFNKLNSIESLKYSLEQLIFSTKNSVHDE